MNQQRQLSPKDWQLLSEYLDGQLSARSQAQLEQRLREHPELRSALEEIRQTRSILRSVRMQRVPRNFTLTPAMARQSRPREILRFVPVLNFASALAALAVIVTLAVQFLPLSTTAASQRAADTAPAAAAAPMAAQPQGTAPAIIQWNGGQNPSGSGPAYGMGGGGGGGGAGGSSVLSSPAPVTVPGFAIPQPLGKGQAQGTPLSPAGGGLEPTPAPGAPAATAAAELPAAPAPTQTPETARSLANQPVTGSGPILGAQPPQVAQADNQAQEKSPAKTANVQQARPIDWVVPSLLALIAIGAAAVAFVIRQQAR